RTAGQQHAVQCVEQAVERLDGRLFVAPEVGPDRRDQDGQAADGVDGRPDILVANRVMPAAAAVFLEAGRDPDQGAQRRAIHVLCRSVQIRTIYSLIWRMGLQMAACRACPRLVQCSPAWYRPPATEKVA